METQRGGGRHRRLCRWNGCTQYASLHDLDTNQDFCIACAAAMLFSGDDPVVNFREFDEGDAYAKLLASRSPLGLFGWPARRP